MSVQNELIDTLCQKRSRTLSFQPQAPRPRPQAPCPTPHALSCVDEEPALLEALGVRRESWGVALSYLEFRGGGLRVQSSGLRVHASGKTGSSYIEFRRRGLKVQSSGLRVHACGKAGSSYLGFLGRRGGLGRGVGVDGAVQEVLLSLPPSPSPTPSLFANACDIHGRRTPRGPATIIF